MLGNLHYDLFFAPGNTHYQLFIKFQNDIRLEGKRQEMKEYDTEVSTKNDFESKGHSKVSMSSCVALLLI